MENLKTNIITVVLIEILVGLISIYTNSSTLIPFIIIGAFSINITSVVLLIKHKPKGYIYLSLFLLFLVFFPILFFFYALSKVQC